MWVEPIAYGGSALLGHKNLLQIGTSQCSFCSVYRVGCNQNRSCPALDLLFFKAAWYFHHNVGTTFFYGLYSFGVSSRQFGEFEVRRCFDTVYQPFGRRTPVVVDDGNAKIFYLQCSRPGKYQHNHTRKYKQ